MNQKTETLHTDSKYLGVSERKCGCVAEPTSALLWREELGTPLALTSGWAGVVHKEKWEAVLHFSQGNKGE